MKKVVRIKDIAQMAQVSMGTVDRVIHGRGKVSPAAREKVMKVLEEIDYKPNLIAKTLSSARTYKIAALLPDPELSSYWKKPVYGINKAFKELSQFSIEVELFVFDSYAADSFKNQAEKVFTYQPDAILIAPILQKEAMEFASVCHERQIPIVCFNTHIDQLNPISFIGQDLHQSGRLAAEIMTMAPVSGTVLIIHIGEKAKNSAHLYKKERGFREYLEQNYPHALDIVTLETLGPVGDQFEKELTQIFEQYSNTSCVFITTSRAYHVAKFLESTQSSHIRLIGYDLVEENIPYLRNGVIDVLIHQKEEKQSFLGISYLTDYLVFKKEVPSMKFLPLSIIIRENLDSYLQADLD